MDVKIRVFLAPKIGIWRNLLSIGQVLDALYLPLKSAFESGGIQTTMTMDVTIKDRLYTVILRNPGGNILDLLDFRKKLE